MHENGVGDTVLLKTDNNGVCDTKWKCCTIDIDVGIHLQLMV